MYLRQVKHGIFDKFLESGQGVKREGFVLLALDTYFRKKMWMTAGLGLFFGGLYLTLILLGSHIIDPELRLDIFHLLYKHPVEFIYLGLLVFACTTITIYLIRMIIIFLYSNSR